MHSTPVRPSPRRRTALAPLRPLPRRRRALPVALLLVLAGTGVGGVAVAWPSAPAQERASTATLEPPPVEPAAPTTAAATPSAEEPPPRSASPTAEGPEPPVPSAAPAAEPPAPVVQPAPAPPPPPPAPAAVAPAAGGPADQVLAATNAERAAAGCGPVATDAALAALAQAHSADMRDRGFFDHTNPDGLGPFDRAARAGVPSARAENIAQGQPDAAAVVAAWMASEGHRRNILDCGLTTLGVGVADGAGGPWWTQLFG